MIFTSTGQAIHLGRQLGAGGAGTVYEIEGQPDLVAKRYHQAPSAEHIERLHVLAQRSDEHLTKIAAWPTDVLFDQPDGDVCGFLMPRVDRAAEVHTLHSPKSRLQKFPDATWAFLIHTAANIARAVATVHEAGFVIGDVNPKNILVTRQGTVALLDCDSFQFESEGTTYRCEAGFPEYTPPELQGVTFREVDRTAQHDAFGLAVVIFQLLFLGRHPFAGKFFGEGEMSLSRAIAEGRFAYGKDSAARQMHAPPGVLPWQALPDELAKLFERTFLTTERPAPREWIEALDTMAQTLVTCALHQGHRYATGLAMCPWCEIEMQARVKLFNVTRKGEGQQSAFRLDDIWREIEQIKAPDALALESLNSAQPSEAALIVAKTQRIGFSLALLVTAVGGLVTGYWGGFCGFVGLSWLALVIAHYCMKLEPHVQTLFINTLSSTTSQDITKAREEAAAKVRHLEQQWDWDIHGRFASKQNELIQHREHYATLDATRDDRLQQLEAATRQDQLRAHLEQFEVSKNELEGSLLTRYLRTNGIKTAADVTPERMNARLVLSRAQKETVLDWRKQKEQLFMFAPDPLIHPTLRQRVLTETEAMRERLEAELRSGALYLRRLRNEVEAAQLAVRDELLNAKQSLAQAEADFKAAGKRRSLMIPVVVLIVAGMVGGLTNFRRDVFNGNDFELGTMQTEKPIANNEMNAEARKLFDEAMEYRKAKTYDRAFTLLEKARYTDPDAAAVSDELSYTYFLAGQYDEAIRVANDSRHFGKTFRPYKNLGLAYAAQGKWSNAKDSLRSAIQLKGKNSLNREDVELRYHLGQALKELGQLPQEIALLGQTDKPPLLDEIQLACLQLWNGNKQQALSITQSLKDRYAPLVDHLEEFINSHQAISAGNVKGQPSKAKKQ